LKSSAFEGELQENEILVTSDTIVWHNDKAVGKPNDKQDAFTILKSLSNTTHEVITSVCFKTIFKTDLLYEITKVTFNELSDEAIHYIDNYKPYDKGSLWDTGMDWFYSRFKIEGSYANVMGCLLTRFMII
jgi:septum formation protein